MTVSRRKFFGLAGAAAVAGVAPGPLMAIAELAAPPVAYIQPGVTKILNALADYTWNDHVLDSMRYSLAYWQVLPRSLIYAGIARSDVFTFEEED